MRNPDESRKELHKIIARYYPEKKDPPDITQMYFDMGFMAGMMERLLQIDETVAVVIKEVITPFDDMDKCYLCGSGQEWKGGYGQAHTYDCPWLKLTKLSKGE